MPIARRWPNAPSKRRPPAFHVLRSELIEPQQPEPIGKLIEYRPLARET